MMIQTKIWNTDPYSNNTASARIGHKTSLINKDHCEIVSGLVTGRVTVISTAFAFLKTSERARCPPAMFVT